MRPIDADELLEHDEVEIIFGYDSVRKVNEDVSCRIEEKSI